MTVPRKVDINKLKNPDKSKLIRQYFIFLLLFTLFYSCGEDIPKYEEVLTVDINTKKVSYKKVEVKGITSLSEFESERFKFLSKARIGMYLEAGDKLDETTATVKELNDVTYKDKGVSPNIRYTVKDDTIIPYTLEDSILLTLQYNLRQAIDFFISNGLNMDKGANALAYGQIKIFYELKFETANQSKEKDVMKDNAMYYPLLNSLAFLKQDKLKHLALVSNPMVITHEFAHSIFAYIAQGVLKDDDVFYETLARNCNEVHSDFYKSAMNEGFSDYWASRKTGSADLFYLSITKHEIGVDETVIADRSLENNRQLTTSMLVTNQMPDYCQSETEGKSYYWAGTIWASSMWEAQKSTNIENFDKYLLKSYACLHEVFSDRMNDITMATPGNCFVKTLKQETDVTQTQINQVCSILKRRFSLIKGEFNECN